MKLSMIYMASGFGRRFGSNKLLASLGGRPLYMYGLTALAEAAVLLQAEGTECQLITVSQYAEILEAARLLPLTGLTVENPYSEEGIAASIRLGTAAAWEDASAFLYFVADQPIQSPPLSLPLHRPFSKAAKRSAVLLQWPAGQPHSLFRLLPAKPYGAKGRQRRPPDHGVPPG